MASEKKWQVNRGIRIGQRPRRDYQRQGDGDPGPDGHGTPNGSSDDGTCYLL